jgi:hypothetical protein
MDKNTTKSTIGEYLIPLNTEYIFKYINFLNLDKYTKKLDTLTFSKLFVFAQMKQISSLTDISMKLGADEKLQKELTLESISTSQLSRKLSAIDPVFYELVFKRLVKKITQEYGIPKGTAALGKIHLIDASTISLCITQYRWAEFRNTKAGVKLHMRIVYCEDTALPDEAILTPAKPADKTQMDGLIVHDEDALNVFDRGYVDYRKFDEYCSEGTRFVTRLKGNATVAVIEERPVQTGSLIQREAVVLLGDPKTYQMKNPLRLIETLDGEGNLVTILTNDMNMSVEELSDVYRKRWQIELFFKWIKQNLKIKRCFGQSANAVYNQIRIALITFCLTLLMKKKVAFQGRLLSIQKWLRHSWDEPFSTFIQKLFHKPTRRSKGRRKLEHERIFEETVHQYEIGEAAHLDDLAYDPVN